MNIRTVKIINPANQMFFNLLLYFAPRARATESKEIAFLSKDILLSNKL